MPTNFLDTETPLTDAIEMEPGVYTRGVQDDDDLDFLWNKEQRKPRESTNKFNMWFFGAGNATGALITSIIFMIYIWQMGPAPANTQPNADKPKAAVEEKVVSPSDLRPSGQATETTDTMSMDDSELPEELTDPIGDIPEEAPPAKAPVAAKPENKNPLSGVFGMLKPKAPAAKAPATPAPAAKPVPTSVAVKPTVKAAPSVTASTPAVGGTTYVVKSGDTLGSIAYQFYKDDWANQVDNLQKVNKLKSVNSLQIGQKVIVPPAIKH